VQAVLGGTATEAGTTLTPLFLGWVLSSIAGARLSVRTGYRRVTGAGPQGTGQVAQRADR
jgi:hypothetical protein